MKYVTAHFDGKKLKELTENKLQTVERMAVLVSSPYLDSGPELLGVPAISGSGGEEQVKDILILLRKYHVLDKVIGGCFDTTNSNTRGY